MALLKYFIRVNSSSGTVLPNPESSLNRVVDRKTIEAANEEVTKIRSEGKGAKQVSIYPGIYEIPSHNCQFHMSHDKVQPSFTCPR